MAAVKARLKEKTYVSWLPDHLNYWVGLCAANELVSVLWKVNGGTCGTSDFVYIEYTVDSTGKLKRGYVKLDSLKDIRGPIESRNYPSIHNTGDQRRGRIFSDTYCGPNPSLYEWAGSISKDEVVGYLGEKVAGYAFIEYWANRQYERIIKHAWVDANNLKF